MPQVLQSFTNGFPGTVSRSIDHIILSLRNDSGAAIPFGAPVFLVPGANACRGWTENDTSAGFLGFAVRAGDKTPDVYGQSTAVWNPDDPVDVLVRGTIVLAMTGAVTPGSPVYLRKADGKLVTSAGADGTTVPLPNVTVRTPRDADGRAEAVVTKRNVL